MLSVPLIRAIKVAIFNYVLRETEGLLVSYLVVPLAPEQHLPSFRKPTDVMTFDQPARPTGSGTIRNSFNVPTKEVPGIPTGMVVVLHVKNGET